MRLTIGLAVLVGLCVSVPVLAQTLASPSNNAMTKLYDETVPADPALMGDDKPVVQAAPSPEVVAESAELGLKFRDRYAFSFTGANVLLELRVNDIPVVTRTFLAQESMNISYNEWLKEGENTIIVKATRAEPKKPYGLTYQFYYQSPTQLPTGERLNLYTSAQKIFVPHAQEVKVLAKTVPLLRLWEAEPVELVAEEKESLIATINRSREELIAAFRAGDNAYIASFDSSIKNDVDAAYGRVTTTAASIIEQRKIIARQFARLVNEPVVASSELSSANIELQQVGDGHLVKATRIDKTPLLSIRRGEVSVVIDYGLYGQVGGMWQRLR